MKVLFVPMVGGRGIGPVCRCLAVANEFLHEEILFLASKAHCKLINGRYEYVENIEPERLGKQGNIVSWNDAAYVMGLSEREFVLASFDYQLELAQSYRPDVIFSEYNLTILLVAKVLGIPVFSTINWADTRGFSQVLSPNLLFPRAIEAYNYLLKKYGEKEVNCIEDLSLLSTKLIAPTTHEQQPELANLDVEYVGELLDRKMELNPKSESFFRDESIYVYMTSSDLETSLWFSSITKVAEKFFDRTFYIVSKDSSMTDSDHLPRNMVIKTWFPSLSVLGKASLVIHSGSANIISGSLLCGVPAIMVPLEDGERLYNALAVERLGCGLIVDKNDFLDYELLAQKMEKILNNPSYQSECKKYKRIIEELGGARKVKDLMMEYS